MTSTEKIKSIPINKYVHKCPNIADTLARVAGITEKWQLEIYERILEDVSFVPQKNKWLAIASGEYACKLAGDEGGGENVDVIVLLTGKFGPRLRVLKGNFTQKMTPFFIIFDHAPKSYGANKKTASKKKMFFDEDKDF